MSNIKRLQEDFNYYLDDLHGDTIICGITFSASDILKELDPVEDKFVFINDKKEKLTLTRVRDKKFDYWHAF